jgi:PIN domain nuclease of toxin-antitoxin system
MDRRAVLRVRVLLDTQAFIHAYGGVPMSRKVETLLADPDTERIISAISIMEIATKSGAGKLQMGEDETREAARDLLLTIIPFTPQHAYRLFSLPRHHRDPFDRMLIATALSEDIPLVGVDRQFKKYKGLKVIW